MTYITYGSVYIGGDGLLNVRPWDSSFYEQSEHIGYITLGLGLSYMIYIFYSLKMLN